MRRIIEQGVLPDNYSDLVKEVIIEQVNYKDIDRVRVCSYAFVSGWPIITNDYTVALFKVKRKED